MCFYQEFFFPGNYSFEFQVIKGGQRDVDVAIVTPNDTLIYHKLIYMSLMKQETAALAAKIGTKNPGDVSAWLFVAKQIKESLHVMEELQKRYRRYEAVDRNNAMSLSARVQDWSLYQSVLVVVIGLGQMIVLKTLFTEKQTRKFIKP
ncbi:PREDICTED: transmembrane emp24 domain-containing protein 3-like [Branchiostoma belcheri]|uniref:Transmembrane emp24 domain-containing protein 3-like n=1 Tax=Branchiostoma belcheri TaxID=7741 RepID=A0A6P4ZUE5_BRABE|nr:PREDICTED: transmembrane emp24 domain-containing protein 3-like [Branchiostoma belcheri]